MPKLYKVNCIVEDEIAVLAESQLEAKKAAIEAFLESGIHRYDVTTDFISEITDLRNIPQQFEEQLPYIGDDIDPESQLAKMTVNELLESRAV